MAIASYTKEDQKDDIYSCIKKFVTLVFHVWLLMEVAVKGYYEVYKLSR